jgi:hypothetical protein
VVALPLEGHDGVHEVLEHPRPGEAAVLGDVADHHGGHGPRLGLRDQPVGALPDLGHRPGCGGHRGIEDGLDAVEREHVGTDLVEVAQDVGKGGLRHQPEVLRQCPQPLRPGPHLRRRLLGGDVEAAQAPLREPGQGLQQQGGLPDPRLAAQQGDRPGDQAALQDAVQLGHAGGPVVAAAGVDLRDGTGRATWGQRPLLRGLRRGDLLHQGPPGVARGAPARPLGLERPAGRAAEGGSRPRHGPTLRGGCDGQVDRSLRPLLALRPGARRRRPRRVEHRRWAPRRWAPPPRVPPGRPRPGDGP